MGAEGVMNQIIQAWINMAKGIKEECRKMKFDLILKMEPKEVI
jgi:hypothetical protein